MLCKICFYIFLNTKKARFSNCSSYQLEIRYKILKSTRLQGKEWSVSEKSRCLGKCWTLGFWIFHFLERNMSHSNSWTLWFNLADCNAVMIRCHIWRTFHCGPGGGSVSAGDLTTPQKDEHIFFFWGTDHRKGSFPSLGRKIWFQELKPSSDSFKLYFDEVSVNEWETHGFYFPEDPYRFKIKEQGACGKTCFRLNPNINVWEIIWNFHESA